MIQVKKITFSYHPHQIILRDLSFQLQQGEFLCVLGSNGIGKTTLLKCLMGINRLTVGELFLNQQKVNDFSKSKKVAYVPQAHRLDFAYTVLEMVIMGRNKYLNTFSMPKPHDVRIAREALDALDILHLENSRCSQISGGQLQMVYLARALATQPKILILDEPESHLDFKNQQLLLMRIYRLSKDRNMICIMNTHHPQNALDLADKVLLLGRNGEYLFESAHRALTKTNIKKFFKVVADVIDLKPLGIDKKIFVVLKQEDKK